MRKPLVAAVLASCLLALLPAPAGADSTEVHIAGGAPTPSEVTIADGDTVTFLNDDDVEHTIFAAGHARGDPIAPHGGSEFGPFQTGGQGGTFAYQVDQGGPGGTIIVQGTATTSPPTSTTRPVTTTTTTRPATTTTTTTTTIPVTTAATDTTTTTTLALTTTTVAGQAGTPKKDDSTRLAVLGVALLVAGLGGLAIATRSRRRRWH